MPKKTREPSRARSKLGMKVRRIHESWLYDNRDDPPYPDERPPLRDHYNFPAEEGKDQRIAIIALGGGYHQQDISQHFEKYVPNRSGEKNLAKVTAVVVDGPGNRPLSFERLKEFVGEYEDLDKLDGELASQFGESIWTAALYTAETTMNIQVAGTGAAEARLEVYFARESPQSLAAAIKAAVESDAARPPIISCSWGWQENFLRQQDIDEVEAALKYAQGKGAIFCAASGNYGSHGGRSDEEGSSRLLVHYPASSQYALACGGTQFGFGGPDVAPDKETVWKDSDFGVQASGGGVSGWIKQPDWQGEFGVPSRKPNNVWVPGGTFTTRRNEPGRGVPDVAAYADQTPGYVMTLGGLETSVGGTSAATPLWASLIACLKQGLGNGGKPFNQLIYDELRHALKHIAGVGRNNGLGSGPYFADSTVWNACCGLGVPHGRDLRSALVGLLSHGKPYTPGKSSLV